MKQYRNLRNNADKVPYMTKKYMMKIFLFCVVDFMNVLEFLKSLDGHLNNWFDEDEHVKVGKMWVKESLVNFKRF